MISVFFPAGFASQGVLNKDHTVWINGAKPANTCIPPFLPGDIPVQLRNITTPQKYICKYKK